MSISTYAELQTAVGNWLNRADLAATIPTFIALAEAQMNRDVRLRSQDAVTRTTLSVSGQFTSLPADINELIHVQVEGSQDSLLEYVTIYEIDAVRIEEPTGTPRVYTITGNEIEVAPVPSSATLELVYYPKIAALSNLNTSNWLLSSSPDIYLYATLLQAAPYLMDDDRINVWGQLYERQCEEFAKHELERKYNSSPLRVRARAFGA